MAQGQVDLSLINRDNRVTVEFDRAMVTETKQTRKNKDGEPVETGVTVYKLKYGETAKAVLEGAGIVIANPDGSAANMHKLALTWEQRDEAALKAKRDAEGVATFLKLVRRRCGLSTSKQKVDDRDKLELSDLRDWVAGKRTVIKRQFADLSAEAQAEVRKMADKLEGKAVAGKGKKLSAMDVLRQWVADGKLEGEQLEAAKVTIKEADERLAKMAAGKAVATAAK